MQQITSKLLIATSALSLTFAACKKNDDPPQQSAALSIINAVTGADTVVPRFNNSYLSTPHYIWGTFVYYNRYVPGIFLNGHNLFATKSGIQPLTIFKYPDTLSSSRPLYNLTLNLPVGSIHTLFLTGTAAKPDTMLAVDLPPNYQVSDTSVGFRFVNLSQGAPPISINLQGQANGSEVSSLPYKNITGFKKFAATSDISSYTFEFRDAATGKLIKAFTANGVNNDGSDPNYPKNLWRFKNYTLALLGLPGETGKAAQTIFLINNY